jgi:ribosomal protein S18 acetylase RimI-like enzyme
MRQHIESCAPWEEYLDLTVVARNEHGQVLGAALSETGRTWLHISVIWVSDLFRRQGLGRKLIETTETEARQRGCRNAYLDTFSYQAQPFYEKLGYMAFGILQDYPPGHQRVFMSKRLV